MVSVRAKFDGKNIEVPAELRGAAPGEVLIVYPADASSVSAGSSIWDAFGKAVHQRSTEEINKQLNNDRDSWERR